MGTSVTRLEWSSWCYAKKVLFANELNCDVVRYAEKSSTLVGAKIEIMTIANGECHNASVESYWTSLLHNLLL